MSGTKQWNLNLFVMMLTQLRFLLINCQAQAVENIVLLYFRFYVYKSDKLIRLTVFLLWMYGPPNIFFTVVVWNCRIIYFHIFYKVNFAPFVCAWFNFYTPFGCPPRSSRKTHRVQCLRSSTFRSLSSLSGLSVYWNNIFIIPTTFFPPCTIEASACKITQAKTKDGRIRTSPGWKNRRSFEQRIHF